MSRKAAPKGRSVAVRKKIPQPASREPSVPSQVTSPSEDEDMNSMRAKSALESVMISSEFDFRNPTKESLASVVQNLDRAISTCKQDGDNLLEDARAKHLMKTIYAYGAFDAIEQLKEGEESPVKDLPMVFNRCLEWLDVDKLPDDKATMWWAFEFGSIAMSWSNSDEQFCRSFTFDAEDMLKWWRQVLTSPKLQQSASSNRHVQQLLEFYIGVLHNLARCSDCKPQLVELNLIEIVHFYLTCGHKTTQCLAMIFAANVMTESDKSLLDDKYGIIPTLVEYLRKALAEDDHTYSGFAAEELAEGCNLAMVNDDNKEKFVASGILPLLEKLMKCGNEKEEWRAVDCLWTLAFGEKQREEILQVSSTIEALEKLAKGKSSVKTKASNALEFIKNGKTNLAKLKAGSSVTDFAAQFRFRSVPVEKPKPADEGHIFLSYSWKQQATVKRICQLLKDKGIKTWMDIDEMRGSTLEAMAGAIEKAKVVLLCYSDDYKQSPNCRTEAEYLFQLRKPFVPVNMQRRYRPDGWLGLIIGARLYIDMSLIKTPFDEASQKLLVELNSVLNPNEPTQAPPAPSYHTEAKIVESPASLAHSDPAETAGVDQVKVVGNGQSKKMLSVAFVKSKIGEWTPGDIDQWLKQQSLSQSGNIASLLKSMSGRHLAVIYEMKTDAAEIFYSSLLQGLDGSLVDVLRLSEALERLPSVLANNK